ncbi:MAG: polysaccharide biosynthesis tyrosine autokinase [Phycisphaerae bacterium]|nr:polysaccharide biosynthesis tyrosine autokinase [Phycisphaerae bacterium]
MTTVPVTMQDRVPMPVPMGPRPGAPAGGMTVNDLIRAMKQRIFLIIFIFLLITGASVALTYYLQEHYPLYPSQAAVLVESPLPRQPMQFEARILQAELVNRFIADQMFLVLDEGLLRDALKDADIQSTRWYATEEDKNLLVETLRNKLEVRQAQGSSFFVVRFATKVRDDAPKIVNTVIRYYLNKVQAMSLEQFSTELGGYRRRQEEMQRTIQQIRDQKETFISSQLGVPGLAAGLNVVGEMWRALAVQQAELEITQLQLRAQWENLRGLAPSEVTLSPQMMMMIDQDPVVAGLKNTLLALRQQRMVLLQRVGPNHQDIQSVDAQLASHQKMLDEVMQQKLEEARQYQVAAAETAWYNALQAQNQLQERVEAAKAEQRDADRKLAQYQTMQEEQAQLEQQYNQITDYINQLDIVVRDRQTVRVRQISPAVPALQRSFPRWEWNIPAGVLLGLVLGIGLALLLEMIDTSIKTPRDVSRHVHVPILGTVPDLDDEEVPIEKMELATWTAPRSLIAEAFRTVRTNLQLSSPAERQRTILVTSAKPEEGKTAVAVNLAIAIAQSNRRVLLVDANFHRPAIKGVFPKARVEGLSNLLVGQAVLDDVVSSSDLPNLDVLSSGPIPPNPAELLASPYLSKMLTQAMDRYDQIIFDGPPALLVSDALVLAGSLDGVLLVCRAKMTSRGVVMRAREQLERAKIRIFGAVLNAAQIARGGYFREQIRTYYDYQPAESLLQAQGPAALPGKGTES